MNVVAIPQKIETELWQRKQAIRLVSQLIDQLSERPAEAIPVWRIVQDEVNRFYSLCGS